MNLSRSRKHMTPIRLLALCVLVTGAVACGEDDELGPPLPTAAVRFVNATGDTGQMDFRIVDVVGDAPQFVDNAFRSGTHYQPVLGGTRRVKIFMTPSQTDEIVGAPTIKDTTFAFTVGTNYTVLTAGFARTGSTPALQTIITGDSPAAPPAGQVAVRVMYAPGSLAPYASGPLDGWVVARGPAALAGTPTFAAVAPGTQTGYVNLPTGTYRIAFTAAGTTSPILFQLNVAPGTAGNNPIGGTNVAGSGVTVYVTSRSVPGSLAPLSFTAIAPFASLTTPDTTAADTIATAVTAAAHGLATGDTVVIDGADTAQAYFRGTFPVTVVNPTTFTYRTNGRPTFVGKRSAGGYPFWYRPALARILPVGGSPVSTWNGRAVVTLTAIGTTATMTTLASHGFVNNDIVTIAGASDPAYNGTFAVTSTGARTFTYTANGTPAASPATGTPVYRAAGVDFTIPSFTMLVDRRPPLILP